MKDGSLRIETNVQDTIINVVCVLLIIACYSFLIFNWQSIPEKIPAHYNATGGIDRFGDKIEILFLPILMLLSYVGMTVVEKYPKYWNTGIRVNEANKERAYRILKDLLMTEKLLVISLFCYLSIYGVQVAPLPPLFLPLLLILTFANIAYHLIRLKKCAAYK